MCWAKCFDDVHPGKVTSAVMFNTSLIKLDLRFPGIGKDGTIEEWKCDPCAEKENKYGFRKCVLCPTTSGNLNKCYAQFKKTIDAYHDWVDIGAYWIHIRCTMMSPVGVFTGIGNFEAFSLEHCSDPDNVSQPRLT